MRDFAAFSSTVPIGFAEPGQGLTPVASTADEFLALIKSDLVRWPKIIKEAGLRAE